MGTPPRHPKLSTWRPPRNAVSILSPSFAHLPSTPTQCGDREVWIPPCSEATQCCEGFPMVLSGETAPIFAIKLLFPVPPPLSGPHIAPAKQDPMSCVPQGALAGLVRQLTLHSPCPSLLLVTTKHCHKHLSPHISQRSFLWSAGGRDVQGRQDRRHPEFKRRGTNMT